MTICHRFGRWLRRAAPPLARIGTGLLGLGVGIGLATPAAAHVAREPGPADTIVLEADQGTPRAGSGPFAQHQWELVRWQQSATDQRALRLAPNADVNAGTTLDAPRLDYPVRVTTAGTYAVCVRAWAQPEGGRDGNDSVHIGVDGTAVTTDRTWGMSGWAGSPHMHWQCETGDNRPVMLTLDAGPHTLMLWGREDGIVVDQIALLGDPRMIRSGDRAPLPPTAQHARATPLPAPVTQPAPELPQARTTTLPATDRATPVSNGFAGLYKWSSQTIVPDIVTQDSYRRYEWRELEPREHQYDFTVIERDLREAATNGHKHGIRVRMMVYKKGLGVPDYMTTRMGRGWWAHDTYVPDWNDQDFLDRAEALITALGQRYNDDPRVGWVEIGVYGNWGEWHMWPFKHTHPYPRPNGAEDMRQANRQAIVDWHRAAFPNKQLLMMTDDPRVLVYALQQDKRIGLRRDSLGTDHFDNLEATIKRQVGDWAWPLVRDRWQTAPTITEFVGPGAHRQPTTYQQAATQARAWHISANGNGNMPWTWNQLSNDSTRALRELGATMGPRIRVATVTAPPVVAAGRAAAITLRWHNDGNVPTYERWRVTLDVQQRDGTVVSSVPVDLDLRTVLPGQHPTTTLTLPATLAPGQYQLVIQARDPDRYRPPFALAMPTRTSTGRYPLTSIEVK